MILKNKTAWLESQYLFPQHFQQQERYLEARIEDRCAAIQPYIWGFQDLRLDVRLLAEGQLSISVAHGVMPDGTPFELPHSASLPPPLKVPENSRDLLVYLALPVYQAGSRYVDCEPGEDSDRVARYRVETLEVFDDSGTAAAAEPIDTAALCFSLILESEELGGYTALPVARVREVTQEGAVILESEHVPPYVNVLKSRRLESYLSDLLGLLKQRGEALAVRFNQSGKAGSGSSAIIDFLLLQLVNRYETRLRHMSHIDQLHPERLYNELAGLQGELSTFTTDSRRPLPVKPYQHSDLHGCFQPLQESLSRQLSTVLEQTATSLPIEARQFGVHVSRISDRTLLQQARFVLAAKADVSTETLRARLPSLIKIGAVETIRTLVNNQLPGIGLSQLPVVPREIPYHAGFTYFELDSSAEQWQQLRNSGGFAFHVAGEFPNLQLELWAIRQ